MNGVYRNNAARAAARSLLGARGRARIPALAGFFALALFVALEVVGLEAAVRASAAALAYLPELRPLFLVERLLAGAFGAAAALVLLGSLTTAVSTLFLSEELLALAVLPIPHRRLLARQAALTLALASAPSLLLALPALGVAASASRARLLAAGAGLLSVAGLFLLAGSLGIAGALVLVRLVPARRARLLTALLSALALSAALLGFRAARPERLLDPVEALGLLQSLGTAAPPAPGASPVGWAARVRRSGSRAIPRDSFQARCCSCSASRRRPSSPPHSPAFTARFGATCARRPRARRVPRGGAPRTRSPASFCAARPRRSCATRRLPRNSARSRRFSSSTF